MSRAEALEEIVRVLAVAREPSVAQYDGRGRGWRQCVLCDGTDDSGPRVMHKTNCPWSRARAIAGR